MSLQENPGAYESLTLLFPAASQRGAGPKSALHRECKGLGTALSI